MANNSQRRNHKIPDTKDYYYHYTTSENKNKILNSKTITPHNPKRFSGNLGTGVYVTKHSPFHATKTQLRNDLYGGSQSSNVDRKLNSYVAIHKRDLQKQGFDVQGYGGRSAYKVDTKQQPINLNKVRYFSGDR